MTRAELKTRAKAQLGNGIFHNNWLYAVLVVLIEGLLLGALNGFPLLDIDGVMPYDCVSLKYAWEVY